MSDAKKTTHLRYALSFQMKYGEVLHLENITKEEKDRYLDFARSKSNTLLVEDSHSLRNLHSDDIAKVSVKAYDAEREKWLHPIQKMLFTESSLGRPLFKGIIKGFIVLAILAVLGKFAIGMIEGGIFDVLLDAKLFMAALISGFEWVESLFKYVAILLVLLSLLDLVLGLNASYFINQDGEEPPEHSRLSNAVVSGLFILIFSVVLSFLSAASNLI